MWPCDEFGFGVTGNLEWGSIGRKRPLQRIGRRIFTVERLESDKVFIGQNGPNSNANIHFKVWWDRSKLWWGSGTTDGPAGSGGAAGARPGHPKIHTDPGMQRRFDTGGLGLS